VNILDWLWRLLGMSNRRLRHVVITSAGTVTSPVLPTLGELSLSASSFTLSATSTANIIGTTTGSSLTATGLPAGLTLDSAARTLSWSGVGTLGSSSFLLTESLVVSGTTITRQTTINYSITVTLVALSLSATSFVNGTASSGTIIGAKTGSTITGSGLPTGFTINSAARTWAFDGTGGISTGTLTLIETLAGATNTPLPTLINYTISAPATITTPVLTQTSTAGTAPFLFDATFDLANTFAGYTLRVQTAAGTGGDFTSPTQDILHTLTESEITSGSVDISSDGFENPSGGFSLRARIERDDGVSSAWSNTLTDTIVSATTIWAHSTGTDFPGTIKFTVNSPYLTATGVNGRGAYAYLRVNQAATVNLWQAELTINKIGGNIRIGADNGALDFSTLPGFPAGATNNNGWYITGGTAGTDFLTNSVGAGTETAVTNGVLATGDILTIVGNKSTGQVRIWRTRSGTTVQLGGSGHVFAGRVTANYGGSTFAHTLNSGFSMYG
jgi:hypothetical protein